jgi:ribosomal protein L7/L12
MDNIIIFGVIFVVISLMLIVVNILIKNKSFQKEFEKSILGQSRENIDEEIKKQILEGNKIKAIKIYKDFSGAGLKEAKDYIEELTDRYFLIKFEQKKSQYSIHNISLNV